jgi:hypothetical protein
MKSSTNKTVLVALAMALWGTSSMAAGGEMSTVPVRQAEDKEMSSATTATSPAPLHALNRLDAETIAGQEITDPELKTVEGGVSFSDLASMYEPGTGWHEFYWAAYGIR